MYFKFKCPQCGQSLKVRQELAGQKRNCPYCKASVRIPNTTEIDLDLPPVESSGFPSFDDGGGASGGGLGGLDLGNLQTDPLSTRSGAAPKGGAKKGAATAPKQTAKPASASSSSSVSEGEFTDPSDVGLLWPGIFGFFAAVAFMLLLWPSKGTYIGDLFLEGGVQGVAIQFLSTFLFFWAMAILWLKQRKIRRQRDYLLMDVLPTDISPEIRIDTLDRFVDNIRQLPGEHGESFLINRVLRGLQHFRVRRSAAETVTMMASQSEIDSNNVASSYTALKVLIWAIPTMGFIGTVLGISLAVASLAGALGGNDPSQLMTSLTSMFSGLGTAFNTTLVALVMSMIIKFPMSSLQKSEEGVLNWVDEYCNENLLRRLNDGREHEAQQPTGPLDTKIFRRAVEEAMAAQQAELEVWINKLELVGQTITKQTTDGWSEIQAKLLDSQKEITSQVMEQVQAKTGEMQTRQEEMRVELQDQLTQMQEIAAQLQATLTALAGAAAQTSNQMNANVAASTERLEEYFSGVAQGLTGLNEVLTKLGDERVVVQQVEASTNGNGGGGWFGFGGGNKKSRRNGKR
ncbi:MotA/TolQ/ExbB proton channel family protein [Blastopirellula sp. JC732]|uniref:MotA/TolQ/ExbB proton channel family protein n=1 Tax=Blastopirellula sediminis TaxID=2894196 RepID=A0A9X1MU75_9BACT|nr:MotA/TolQ/ExbB proton channel family protein [Blastopirellula sediminis]MCC9605016.1 MotA/TolQ/ExbB proton channel family protein [Blastopirellula sediminis]MCC9631684.1 MotA/TolQ/ExbB proton channel family protein [Blastopirellula sediminis]